MISRVKWLSNVQCRMINLEKGKNMKTTYTHILLICLFALGAMQAKALNYQNTYQPSTYDMPQVTFQSTSAYSYQWSEMQQTTSTLNSDGTVNESTYLAEQENTSSGPRRVGGQSGTPGQGGDKQPLGDVLFPLMLMALGYFVIRRRRSARSQALLGTWSRDGPVQVSIYIAYTFTII